MVPILNQLLLKLRNAATQKLWLGPTFPEYSNDCTNSHIVRFQSTKNLLTEFFLCVDVSGHILLLYVKALR